MDVYCAWCGERLGEKPAVAGMDGMRTHGICVDCRAAFLNQNGEPLGAFLDRLGVPVLLVDDDVMVLDATESAVTELGKDAASIVGRMGGEVFECANADLPGGCGRTIHCSGCALRRTVTATHEDGIPRIRVPASLKIRNETEPATVDLLISTVRTKGKVVLRVERVS